MKADPSTRPTADYVFGVAQTMYAKFRSVKTTEDTK